MLQFQREGEEYAKNFPPVRVAIPLDPHREVNDLLALRIATDAVQLFGGYGYITDNRVERLLRDAKITQIWEGTNQIHRQLIGRSFIEK